MSAAVCLNVEIVAHRYINDDQSWGVITARSDDGDEITLVGSICYLEHGDYVEVNGSWSSHPIYGNQLKVESVANAKPTNIDGVRRVLTSIKHIGPSRADDLLNIYGTDVLETLNENPDRVLGKIYKEGSSKHRSALDSWQAQAGTSDLRLMLATHNLPAATLTRIVTKFGPDGYDRLRSDPFLLFDIERIGFKTADLLARELGVEAKDPRRIEVGMISVLTTAAGQGGHCYLSRSDLIAQTASLLMLDPAVIDAAIDSSDVVVDGGGDGDRILAPAIDRAERRLAAHIAELVAAPALIDLELPDDPPADAELSPTADQWAAVKLVAEHRLSILTGLPGTGKTQTVRTLVDQILAAGRDVTLCAPTGKAARRLSELTDAPAMTIHRLLAYQPGIGFTRDSEDPLTGIDLLVVDEASMLDLWLAAALFDAVGTSSHVLLVGDDRQLAPIGPGRVFGDLLSGGQVPQVHLTEIFRQAERSLTVQAAHAIDAGLRPRTAATDDEVRDFFLSEHASATAVFDQVISLADRRLADHYQLDPVRDIQVLSGIRKGPAGINLLNERLRELRNADGEPIKGSNLRVGDRVMQTVNDYDHEFYNGEIGFIVDADKGEMIIVLDDGRNLRLSVTGSQSLTLAYACSVHKMQGSQAKAVIVAMACGHKPVLTRNLLYTAVTRSQLCCVLVAEQGAIDMALAHNDASGRATRLTELLVDLR